jgi:hypothetical protein
MHSHLQNLYVCTFEGNDVLQLSIFKRNCSSYVADNHAKSGPPCEKYHFAGVKLV